MDNRLPTGCYKHGPIIIGQCEQKKVGLCHFLLEFSFAVEKKLILRGVTFAALQHFIRLMNQYYLKCSISRC